MAYDPDNLTRLGKRSAKLRAELEAITPQLQTEIRAALAAGVSIGEVIKASGYTRDGVYKISRGIRGKA